MAKHHLSASEDMFPTTINKTKLKRPKTSKPGKNKLKLNLKRGVPKRPSKKIRPSRSLKRGIGIQKRKTSVGEEIELEGTQKVQKKRSSLSPVLTHKQQEVSNYKVIGSHITATKKKKKIRTG